MQKKGQKRRGFKKRKKKKESKRKPGYNGSRIGVVKKLVILMEYLRLISGSFLAKRWKKCQVSKMEDLQE